MPVTAATERFTEAEVLEALRARYTVPGNGGAGRHAFLTHVRVGASFEQQEIDAVVFDLWPSDGFLIHAFEVEVFAVRLAARGPVPRRSRRDAPVDLEVGGRARPVRHVHGRRAGGRRSARVRAHRRGSNVEGSGRAARGLGTGRGDAVEGRRRPTPTNRRAGRQGPDRVDGPAIVRRRDAAPRRRGSRLPIGATGGRGPRVLAHVAASAYHRRRERDGRMARRPRARDAPRANDSRTLGPPRWVDYGFLWDLPADARRRLDEVLEARAMSGVERRPYRKRKPKVEASDAGSGDDVEAPTAQDPSPRRPAPRDPSLAARVRETLEAEPALRYAEAAARLEASVQYVGQVARASGLARGERGRPTWGSRPATAPRHTRESEWSIADPEDPEGSAHRACPDAGPRGVLPHGLGTDEDAEGLRSGGRVEDGAAARHRPARVGTATAGGAASASGRAGEGSRRPPPETARRGPRPGLDAVRGRALGPAGSRSGTVCGSQISRRCCARRGASPSPRCGPASDEGSTLGRPRRRDGSTGRPNPATTSVR